MKRYIVFTAFILLISRQLFAQAPFQLFDFTKANTYMYFPEVPSKTKEFYIHSNYHFLRFNTEELKLTQMTGLAPYEKLEDISIHKEEADILSMYLEYNGERYKVIKEEKDKKFLGRWIEGGKYYQRRLIPNLILEDGPLFSFSLEIASWPDAFSFTLSCEEDFIPEDVEMKLLVEIETPNTLYKVDQKNKNLVQVVSKKEVEWEVTTNDKNNTLKYSNEKIQVEGDLKQKHISALFHRKMAYKSNDGLIVSAIDKKEPYTDLKPYKDLKRQATVIPLSGNMEKFEGLERTGLFLQNTSDEIRYERLIFEKKHQVKNITGTTMILRDKEGNPIGLPIQVSKNWHTEHNRKYSGTWLRGFTIVSIPPNTTLELELSRINGFWGQLPAVSHSQLSLEGWGQNVPNNHQLWEQTSLGAYGVNMCLDPNKNLTGSLINDLRPFYVQSTKAGISAPQKHDWTPNIGGGDVLKIYDNKGEIVEIKETKVDQVRTGPILTEIVYRGKTGDDKADFKLTTYIIRTDDYLRTFFHVELNVQKTINYSKLAIAQFSSKDYSDNLEDGLAYGNEKGLYPDVDQIKDINGFAIQRVNATGAAPWVSMHKAINQRPQKYGTWGNKGLILREWNTIIDKKLNQAQFTSYMKEIKTGNGKTYERMIELNLPNQKRQLNKGDKIDAIIELCVLPNEPNAYYGTNTLFKEFINKNADTWKPMYREAYLNTQKISVKKGKLTRQIPIRIEAEDNEVVVDISNGLGYVPVTITNITDYQNFKLILTKGGEFVNLKEQEKYGNDYWQTDFNPDTKTWEITYSVLMDSDLNLN
ncbi:hypothetical protein [Flammeovirga aprica]|uniref:Uncharacterized protein n=1 Tax=Flammeovirga aprica JL-4 TaxID=694437 RepID=A0A7X9RWY9_9BACT|nr:hypothetical protein [Flammeovirga aprica]NME70134.1 hypothetical protein [Flammeovirga aprica JL-4]